jgi:GTP-binding protein HflX
MAEPTREQTSEERPPAVLVAVRLPGVTEEQHAADLAELSRLVKTLGLRVVGQVTQSLSKLSPATVVGGGKLLELAAWTGGDGVVEPSIAGRDRAMERRERLKARRGEPDEDGGLPHFELDDRDPTNWTPSEDDESEDPRRAAARRREAAAPDRDADSHEHDTSAHADAEAAEQDERDAAGDDGDDFHGRDASDHDDAEPDERDAMGDDRDAAAPHSAPHELAKVVVVDHELSPRMQRNLERATGAEVLDRTHVIVEIFHRHARSREARLQVEIARLSYVAPRLREAGAGKDRVRGGVGGKGAGESALELDRRKIRDRIAELRRELSQIEREQATRRAGRSGQRRVALVGYTNAGKSSLMRALTSSGVYVADKLFATLDTTVRALRPETDPRILVSDTVGFIKKLPHELVASFRSTLDEALEASLLLYVVDASDPTFRDQLAVTREVLHDIGAGEVTSRLVLNKRDRLDPAAVEALRQEYPEAVLLSAHDPDDVLHLRELIVSFFDGELRQAELFVPYASQALIHHVYEGTTVLSERHTEEGTHLQVRAPQSTLRRLEHRLATPRG